MAGHEGNAELERDARAAHARFGAGIRAADAHLASRVYVADARLLAPSADLIAGREAIESFWRAGLDAGIRAVRREPLGLEVHGPVGLEIGHYAIRLRRADGMFVVDRGTYLLLHEPAPDGTWAWSLEMFTPDGAPDAGPPAAAFGRSLEVGDRD